MKYRPIPPFLLLRRWLRSVENNGVRGAMAHSCRRLARSLQQHGLRGTFERAFIKAPQAPPRELLQGPHPFDLLYGTETGGICSAADLNAVSLSALYATGYRGVPPSALRSALAALPVKHEDFSFVDIGCGKGRALLVAAEFPFCRICGVEIAGELCRSARANVALKPEWEQRISIAEQDAAAYIYPQGPLILYLFRPFYASLLRRVLANLQRQLQQSPRPAYILYADFCSTTDPDRISPAQPSSQGVLNSFPTMRVLSDKPYPLSAEDAAAEPGVGAIRFTLHSFDVSPVLSSK